MWAAAVPASTLAWTAMHGGYRGVSRDRQRKYWEQPVTLDGSPCGWWAVTSSEHVTERQLIRSREGAMQLAETWEADPSWIM